MHIHCIFLYDISTVHNSLRSRSSTSCYLFDRYSFGCLDHFIYLQRYWNRYKSLLSHSQYSLFISLNTNIIDNLVTRIREPFYMFYFSNFPMETWGWQAHSRTSIPKTLPHILAHVQLVCRFLFPNRIITQALGNPY